MKNLLRTDIINLYIEKFNYKKYLEIGVQFGQNISKINCETKHGVDVAKHTDSVTHHMSSDDFFKQNSNYYDIIFIDGHHDSEFVCKDINNSIRWLNPNGKIILHDCFPPSKTYSLKLNEWKNSPNDGSWCGDGFKVIHSIYKNYNNYYDIFVIDTDYGVGVLSPKTKQIINIDYDDSYTWESMKNNPIDQINLITVDEFLKIIN